MAKIQPRTGEAVTANFGWTKPTVGASDDVWGGQINADLDSIDSTVYSVQATKLNAAGITNGSNASPGVIGEVQQGSLANTGSLTNSALFAVTSVSLTAGDWDVYGTVSYVPASGTSTTALNAGISTSNAAISTGGSAVNAYYTAAAGFGFTVACAPCRINVNATTQVFLMANAAFSGGTCNVGGEIWARRAR